jgi:large subunit ribosomal protein L6
VNVDGQQLQVGRSSDEQSDKALHGLYRALIANMVHGVVSGFSKELEIVGVGYRAQLQGKQLSLHVGFSHPVLVPIPEGITIEVPKPTAVIVKGPDKQCVGQFAANLRRIAPPEPYKGKGIKYVGETIRRKAGKAATGTGAKAAG